MLSLVAAASLFAAPFSATFAFGRTPPFTALEVSPNGDMVAANFYEDGIHGLQIFDLQQNRMTDTWEMEPGLEISKFYWKRDDLLVIGLVSYRSQMAAYWGLSGLITRAPGEDKIRSLFPDELNDIIDKDNVVAWLPDDPDHILVMYAEDLYKGNGVYKINLNDPSQHEVVIKPQTRIVGYVATQDGHIRGRAKVGSYGRLNWSLKKANGGWRNITRRMTNENIFFDVYGFPQDERYAYVGSNHETDTVALYLFDIQSGDFVERIYHDPSSDLYGIVQRPSDGQVVGVKYADTRIRIRWLEQGEEESRTRLIERSLDADLADMITITPDETAAGYVVQAGSRPERVIIFDFDANSYTELPGQYPELEGVELARVISTSYKARDGLEIPAFVTLPPGINTLEEAKDLPFVVLPHGGPNVRDFETFDWLAQFIAFRQHGVLQMNFRGSRGYGQAFMEQGNQSWGQAMQDDITDGTKWLIDQGHADANRIAIAGASYGGYAALMGTIKEADLYRCAASINGVTDLIALIKNTNPSQRRSTRRMIGSLWGDRAMLRENSPAQRAADISVPVLLIQSQRDQIVPKSQAILMRDALVEAGGDVTYTELKYGNHYLTYGNNRITMLRELEDFLYDCLDKHAIKNPDAR